MTVRYVADTAHPNRWEPYGPRDAPVGEVSWVHRGGNGKTSVGLWRVTPPQFTPSVQGFSSSRDETIYVLKGEAVIELDDRPPIALRPGVVLFIPAGTRKHWVIRTPYEELFVFS